MDRAGEYRLWKTWSEEAFNGFDRSQACYFAAEFAQAGAPLSQEISVLEIGFGNGAFAGWAREQGWRYVGTELDPELVARGRAAGLEVHASSEGLESVAAGRTFDVVVIFDVLEHLTIDEIRLMLASVSACLASTGVLIARFPSGDSPFSRAIQYGDVTHRSVIGSGMIQQLALGAGLRAAQIRAPAFPVAGLGLARALRRSVIWIGRAILGRLVQIIYFDNQPRVVEPNMVAVLRPTSASRENGG